jgi:type IV pilus assembly protein PilQ
MRRGILLALLTVFLLPGLAPAGATYSAVAVQKHPKWMGEPMSLDVKDLDIRDFFRLIADIGRLNVIIDPSVRGSVTMKVHDVPWDQLLDIVCRMNGLGYELDGNVVGVREIGGRR